MIHDGVTGRLVPPADVDALAASLRWVLSHDAEVEAMGRRGRDAARQLFSTETYLNGYRRLFALATALLDNPARHERWRTG
jgi:glycosyltransferase involved in cell wall biosynthesis